MGVACSSRAWSGVLRSTGDCRRGSGTGAFSRSGVAKCGALRDASMAAPRLVCRAEKAQSVAASLETRSAESWRMTALTRPEALRGRTTRCCISWRETRARGRRRRQNPLKEARARPWIRSAISTCSLFSSSPPRAKKVGRSLLSELLLGQQEQSQGLSGCSYRRQCVPAVF